MMKKPSLLAIAFGLAALLHSEAVAQRHALVIGNSRYQHAPELANPVNDASSVAENLQKGGFKVNFKSDLGVREILKSLQEFCEQSENADLAVFFFAGHGIEVRGENYLLPINATLEEEVDLGLETLPLQKVLDSMGKSSARLKLVILDCCRTNPFSSRSWMRQRTIGSGLARVPQEAIAEGTMLVYAGAPGQAVSDGVDGHSPFTTALLTELNTPDQSILATFSSIARKLVHSEPWVRFDGSGKSLATFGSFPMLSENKSPARVAKPIMPLDPTLGDLASDQSVKDFISRFLLCGEDDDPDLELSFYADDVENYFGTKNQDKDAIRLDRARYITKWPFRRYIPIGEPEVLQRTANDIIARARFRFVVSNEAGGDGEKKELKGEGAAYYKIRDAGGKLEIFWIDESLDRE